MMKKAPGCMGGPSEVNALTSEAPLVLRTGGADLVADRAEGRIGAGAQSGDGHKAHHDDQGQHDGVFNGRRAVFRLQELNYELTELAHRNFPFRKLENHPVARVIGSPHRSLTSIPRMIDS